MGTIRVLQYDQELRLGRTPVEWVLIANTDSMSSSGAQSTTWMRVRDLIPPPASQNIALDSEHMMVQQAIWDVIRPQYEALRDQGEIPEHGTSLAAWGGASAQQIKTLRQVGVMTIEQLADLSDTVMAAPVLPNLRDLRTQAKQWLEGRPQAEMLARLAALEAQNQLLTEQLDSGEPVKRKPGRPRKVEEEEAA
jgi:predicted RecB family nuclease